MEEAAIQFFDPSQALVDIEKNMDGIPNPELFNNSKHQKLTEAWCAYMFGIGYKKYVGDCAVGVNETNSNTEADFYLKSKNAIWPFQLTEVQHAGRKRGKEYKESPRSSAMYRPSKANKNAVRWVHSGTEKKAAKNYAGSEDLNLIVYVNFETAKFDYRSISDSAKEFIGKFKSVWLLTNTHFCSLFSDSTLGQVPGWGEVRSIEEDYVQ